MYKFSRQAWGRSVILITLAWSASVRARPVGEWIETRTAAATETEFAQTGNFFEIAGALNATLIHQGTKARRVAGANPPVFVTVAPGTLGAGASPAEGTKFDADAEPGEVALAPTPVKPSDWRESGSLGYGSPSPVSATQMPDLSDSAGGSGLSPIRSPGALTSGGGSAVAMPDLFRSSSGSILGNRGPAVLPKADPTLPAMKSGNTTFGNKEELSLAKSAQDLLAEELEREKKRREAKQALEQSRKEQVAQAVFEAGITDLLARTTPYEKKDYEDFREFIAKQRDRLTDTDTTATDFKTKARDAFEMYEKEDTKPLTADAKEQYRRFITDTGMNDGAQELLVAKPRPRAEPMPAPIMRPRPTH